MDKLTWEKSKNSNEDILYGIGDFSPMYIVVSQYFGWKSELQKLLISIPIKKLICFYVWLIHENVMCTLGYKL